MTAVASRVIEVLASEFAGGAEAYAVRLAVGLQSRGREVSLLGKIPGWTDAAGDQISLTRALGPKWRSRTLIRGLLRLPAERRAVRLACDELNGPVVFHLHMKREQIGLTALLSRYGPVVWTEHGRFPGGIFGRALNPFYRRASRHAARVLCVSDYVRADIATRVHKRTALAMVGNAVEGIPQPVAQNARVAARKRLGIQENAWVIVFVGRLEESKRPSLAIEGGLQAGATVVVCGGGALEGRMRAIYESAKVHFTGHISDPADVWLAADIHVFSSNGAGEGMPTVLLEAAQHGIPSIAVRDSGFAQMVEDAGGRVAGPSPHAIAKCIDGLRLDSAAASAASVRWASVNTFEAWIDRHDTLFSSLTSGAGREERP